MIVNSFKTYFACLAMAMAFIVTIPAYAGVEMTQSDGTKMYFSANQMKHIDAEGERGVWHIMDADKGMFYMVNDNIKSYTSGTPEEFCSQFTSMMSGMMEEMMKRMPPEYKEQMEAAKKAEPEADVQMKNAGNGGAVAGYKTEKYNVIANGSSHGDVWVTNDASLIKELGSSRVKLAGMIDKATGCMRQLSHAGGMGGQDIENSAAYAQAYTGLLGKGFIVKEAHNGDTRYEIVKIEKKDIQDSEFQVPAGYKKVPFTTLIGMPATH